MTAVPEDEFNARVELTLLRSHLQTTDHALAYLMRYPSDERADAVSRELTALMMQICRVIEGQDKQDA